MGGGRFGGGGTVFERFVQDGAICRATLYCHANVALACGGDSVREASF